MPGGGTGPGGDAAAGVAGGMDQVGADGVPRAAGIAGGCGFVGAPASFLVEATGVAGHWLIFGAALPSVILPPEFVTLPGEFVAPAGRKLGSVGLLGGR